MGEPAPQERVEDRVLELALVRGGAGEIGHRTNYLPREHVTTVRGIPVTTAERTLEVYRGSDRRNVTVKLGERPTDLGN